MRKHDRFGLLTRLTVASAIVAAVATSASAADVASKADEPEFKEEAPPPMPIFSWTGPYAGLHAGYGFGRDSGVRTTAGAGAQPFASAPNGVMGGAHVGYNYAIGRGNTLVIGIEADADGADHRGKSTPNGALPGRSDIATQSDVKGSVRGRLGYAANRTLFYATGGIAFADFETRYNVAPVMAPLLSSGTFDTADRTRTGYTLGGGVEYAFMNTLSVRAEYRYTNYGTFTDTPNTTAPGLAPVVSHHETDNRLQAGISYKFQPTMQ